MRRAALLALCACHGADPSWDMYALESWYLADLPSPVLHVTITGQGTDAALQLRLDAELPCPIPLARAVHATAAGVEMTATGGDKRGNGVGESCNNPVFRVPLAALPADPATLDLALDDGRTRWTMTLLRPLAPRVALPVEARGSPGDTLHFRVGPPEERWRANPPGAEAVGAQLRAQAPDPLGRCVAEELVPLPDAPTELLALEIPEGFCPGPAWLGLSSSARREAVATCPTGVSCRFEVGGYVGEVAVDAPQPTSPSE